MMNINFWNDVKNTKNQNLLVLALIFFFVVFGILSVKDKSITTDEGSHLHYGMNILNLDSDRLEVAPGIYDDSKMPIIALNALPAKIAEGLPGSIAKNLLNKLIAARLVTIIFSAWIAWLVFQWSRSLYGVMPAFVSLALYILDPNIIAHSQLVTTDIYAAGTILLASYSFWKFANTRQLSDGLLSAFALGLSEIAKYACIVLLPLFVFALILHDLPAYISAYREKGMQGLEHYLTQLAIYIVVGSAFIIAIINFAFLFNHSFTPLDQYMFLSYPFKFIQSIKFIRDLRIPFPYPYLQGLDHVIYNERTGASFDNIYLLGQLNSGRGFAGYYFIAAGLKVPIATQLVMIVATVTYAVSKRLRKTFLKNEVFMLLPVLFYMIYFNFFYNAQIGIRYYLVIFPLLYVFSGCLFINWAAFSVKQKMSTFALALYLIGSVASYYPFYLSYFNEFVWDRKYAYKYLADSNLDWMQGQYYLDNYMDTHPNAILLPSKPRSGVIIVPADFLVGVRPKTDPKLYKWLRDNFQPEGTIAYEYLIFDISPQELRQFCSRTPYCR